MTKDELRRVWRRWEREECENADVIHALAQYFGSSAPEPTPSREFLDEAPGTEFDEVAARAWDFVRPKLLALHDEKGPAGVWSNGFRSGWTNAKAATPSRESSDELASLAAKYLGMEEQAFLELVDPFSTDYAATADGGDSARAVFADIKRLAGSVLSQAGGGGVEWDDEDAVDIGWNAAADSIARLADRHYQGGEVAAIKRGLWVYDTDIGSLVRSLRHPLPTPPSIPTEKDTR